VLSVKSLADLNRAVMSNLHRIDRESFDVVVGIPRSGMIPAAIIATQLQMPLADVLSFTKGLAWGRSGKAIDAMPRALLVDDSVNKGRAMSEAARRVSVSASSITRLAVYGPYQVDPGQVVDIALETCAGPRVFEWNMAKHIRLPRWGVDFDGVLCRDPRKDENDDGDRYKAFLTSAEPILLPKRQVGHIVTGRLEKYRGETEVWLRRHGVEFGALHMMPYATKAERMAAGGRGAWKASVAKSLGIEFFIESDAKQAGIIARDAGIPVWCTETRGLAPC
jgi:hypoxanthine phosphoribosyltransferase